MKHFINSIGCLFVLFAAFAVSSCRDNSFEWEDMYNPQHSEFAKNFVKKYGTIPSDKSWDFSSYASNNIEAEGTRAGENVTVTPVDGLNFQVKNTINGDKITTSYNTSTNNYSLYSLTKTNLNTDQDAKNLAISSGNYWIYPVTTRINSEYSVKVVLGGQEENLFTKDWSTHKNNEVTICNEMGIETSTTQIPVGTWVDVNGEENKVTYKIKSYEDYYLKKALEIGDKKEANADEYIFVKDNDGKMHLLNVTQSTKDNPKFVVFNYTSRSVLIFFRRYDPSISFDNDFSNSSVVDVSGVGGKYYINFGNWRIWHHLALFTNDLGIRRNNFITGDPFKWSLVDQTITEEAKIKTIDSYLLTSGSYVSKKAKMPGMKIETGNDNPKTVDIQVNVGGTVYSLNNGDAKFLNIKKDGANILPDEFTKEEESDTDYNVKYVGFKLSNGGSYRDLILAVVCEDKSKNIAPITIDEDKTESEVIAKRYMVEDLGDTGDTDFNDIVFDVARTRSKTTKKCSINGETLSDDITYGAASYNVHICHLGGTLPWTLQIGSYVVPGWRDGELQDGATVITKPTNNYTFDITYGSGDTPWIPEQNNVKVYINWSKDTGVTPYDVRNSESVGIYTVEFPKPGTVPFIIATDVKYRTDGATPIQTWMDERVSLLDELAKDPDYLRK